MCTENREEAPQELPVEEINGETAAPQAEAEAPAEPTPEEALAADRVVVMDHGRIVLEGTPAEVITEENIREAYGGEAHVHTSSRTGTPMVLPLAAVRKTEYVF